MLHDIAVGSATADPHNLRPESSAHDLLTSLGMVPLGKQAMKYHDTSSIYKCEFYLIARSSLRV
jgi:hypothetical protein